MTAVLQLVLLSHLTRDPAISIVPLLPARPCAPARRACAAVSDTRRLRGWNVLVDFPYQGGVNFTYTEPCKSEPFRDVRRIHILPSSKTFPGLQRKPHPRGPALRALSVHLPLFPVPCRWTRATGDLSAWHLSPSTSSRCTQVGTWVSFVPLGGQPTSSEWAYRRLLTPSSIDDPLASSCLCLGQ